MSKVLKIKNKFRTTESFKEELYLVNPNVEVIGEFINTSTPIKCKCLKCGFDNWDAYVHNLLYGLGCPVCNNKLVVHGINDVTTTRPDLVKFFNDSEDAKKCTAGSNKTFSFKCPDCGNIRQLKVSDISRYKFSCDVCGDKISYPNKFGRSLLKQLQLEKIKTEWKPDWAIPYCYDNYFEYHGDKYILEMDGMWHYIDNKISGKTYEEIKRIDDYKDELALKHGINVIRIDCRYSEKEYIKRNIESSQLSRIFDLSLIDWDKCEIDANKNITFEICKYYNENKCTLKEMGKIFNIGWGSIRRMLIVGTKNNWCNYIVRKSKIPVEVFNSKKELIGSFETIKSCAKYMKENMDLSFSHRAAKKLSTYGDVTYKGYYFKIVS